MENILVIGLNNSISSHLINSIEYTKNFRLFFTTSKRQSVNISEQVFYLNFNEEFIDNQLIEDKQLLCSFEKIIFISSYYGDKSEKFNLAQIVIANRFLMNVQKFIFNYIEAKQEKSRIVFVGSIAGDNNVKSSYPGYKQFKLGIKSLSQLINTYYNKFSISSSYINLGSFISNQNERNTSRLITKDVIDLILFLIGLDINVKVDVVNFKPMNE